jgi:hypothetical protein
LVRVQLLNEHKDFGLVGRLFGDVHGVIWELTFEVAGACGSWARSQQDDRVRRLMRQFVRSYRAYLSNRSWR